MTIAIVAIIAFFIGGIVGYGAGFRSSTREGEMIAAADRMLWNERKRRRA